jgi:hypothetical protein
MVKSKLVVFRPATNPSVTAAVSPLATETVGTVNSFMPTNKKRLRFSSKPHVFIIISVVGTTTKCALYSQKAFRLGIGAIDCLLKV